MKPWRYIISQIQNVQSSTQQMRERETTIENDLKDMTKNVQVF